MNEYLELFRDISKTIEKNLVNIFGTKKARKEFKKGSFGDVTVYIDKIAEDIIIEKIEKENIKCSILTEESGWIELGAKTPIVIVDPIDGSLNAKRGLPYFSFSIALSSSNTTDGIFVGFVKNLSNKDEFYAQKNNGAFLNGNRIKPFSNALNVVAVEGFKKKTDPELIKFIFSKFNKVRQMGSLALDLCYLATGAFDAFLNIVDSRVVDYAASKIILEEAGGGVYEWISNKPFVADVVLDKSDRFFCVSKTEFAEEFVSIMGELL